MDLELDVRRSAVEAAVPADIRGLLPVYLVKAERPSP
jgi:hypothetical protein